SEWYKRNSRTRRKNEAGARKDYKELTRKMLFEDFDLHFTSKSTRYVGGQYRKMFVKIDGFAQPKHYRQMHDALIAGDPKQRTLRALYQNVFGDYADYAKADRRGGAAHG
ncbi:MAG: hypothetical protein J6Z15_06165, partial [Oscillospiraceae bacterium]|nr:hypothetical protein [Oscillospiraceae bacterium]